MSPRMRAVLGAQWLRLAREVGVLGGVIAGCNADASRCVPRDEDAAWEATTRMVGAADTAAAAALVLRDVSRSPAPRRVGAHRVGHRPTDSDLLAGW